MAASPPTTWPEKRWLLPDNLFFWSEHFDQFLQYVGHATAWDDLIIQGDLTTRNFLAFYVKGDRILAAAGLQRDRQLAAFSELMRLDKLPSP